MGIPLFLLFAVYGVVNAYLPILLFDLGYSATMIGVLQGVFEAAGLLFPVFVSSKVDKKGNYGVIMILLGLLMVVVLPLLVLINDFWVTALALALFAIGYKGAVPVADALVSRRLGADTTNYGKIRVMGSIGFVCITLLLQFTRLVDASSPASIALWIGIPAVHFSLSVAVVPGILKSWPPKDASDTDDAKILVADTPVPATARAFSLADFPVSFWLGIFLIFLGFLGLTPSQRFFSLYVQEYLHLESYAGLWALGAMAEVPFMFLSGWFIRRFATEKILLLSLLAIIARNLVYAVFPTFAGAVAGQLFHSVCFGLFHPAAIIFITERVPKRLMAVGLTLYTSVSVGVASVLGNILGGLVIDSLGYRSLFIVFSAFPLIGIVVFVCFRKRLYARH
jgi:MFS transporter, PPP family, 3-phenylpropionic acid transporter